jgi:glutathione S-transferase
VAEALAEMKGHFWDLDRRLAANEWLINRAFTLADVAA